MDLSRVACKYWDITVTPTLANGNPATITGVELALVPPGASPDRYTTWLPSVYLNGLATILVAGPEYLNPPAGALVVPPVGANMWARYTDSPERDAKLVDCIRLI